MSDLISRGETIARFVGAMRSREKSEHPMPLTEERIIRFLKAMPSAEPKVGKWIHDPNRERGIICSRCGETQPFKGWNSYLSHHNYCPNCGAKMERSE